MEKKIGFKDLKWYLKTLVIIASIGIGFYALIFLIYFIIGFMSVF